MTLSGHAAGQANTVAWCWQHRRDSAMEVDAMSEQVDLRVPDRVALDEIELYAEVLSAVATAQRRLTAAELDEVLGLRSADDGGGATGHVPGRASSRIDRAAPVPD